MVGDMSRGSVYSGVGGCVQGYSGPKYLMKEIYWPHSSCIDEIFDILQLIKNESKYYVIMGYLNIHINDKRDDQVIDQISVC